MRHLERERERKRERRLELDKERERKREQCAQWLKLASPMAAMSESSSMQRRRSRVCADKGVGVADVIDCFET